MPRHLVHYNQRSRRRIDLCRHIICPSAALAVSGVTLRRHLTHARKFFFRSVLPFYHHSPVSASAILRLMQIIFNFTVSPAQHIPIPSKVKCFSYGTSPDLSDFLCFLFAFDEFLMETRFISAAFRARMPNFGLSGHLLRPVRPSALPLP